MMNIKSLFINPARPVGKGSSFVFLAIFLLFSFLSQATTYYVDARTGSDDFDGTAAIYQGGNIGPWKTIAKINAASFAPGDSILFRRGSTWTDGPLIPPNGGEAAGVFIVQDQILSQTIQFELLDPGNHNAIYFGAYGSGAKPKIDCAGDEGLIIRHNYIIVEDLHLDNGADDMLKFDREGGNFWNVIRRVDVTNGTGNAVRFRQGGGHCWLDGIYVYNYENNGIYLEGSPANPLQYVLVENCHVENPTLVETFDGISCHRDELENNITGDIIIRNNTIIRSGEDGIDITSGTNILLEGNVIELCDNGGIFVAKDRVNTVEIRGNFLNSNSYDDGIGDLTIACSKVRAVNNIIVGTGHHCLHLEEASEVQIWNNIIAPGQRTGNLVWLFDGLSQIEFRNNIFDFSSQSQIISGPLDGSSFDYNCYFGVSTSQQIFSDGTLQDLRALDPGFETNGFWADPLFVGTDKAAPADFQLADNSPCLNRGADVPLELDFLQQKRPLQGRIDIGVFESEAAAVPGADCSLVDNLYSCSVDIPIISGDDDVEEEITTGSVDRNSTDLELILDQASQIVGLRFNYIFVPPGAKIDNAYIQFTTDDTTSVVASVFIQGENSDNALPFANTDFDVSSRIPTTASVDWNIPVWSMIGAADTAQRTPDLSLIVQEIVDRAGWNSGKSMVFLITGGGVRKAVSYDGSPDQAPVLHIEYSVLDCPEAGTACDDGDPATFDDVEDGNCNCAGTPCPEAGTACDDGDPSTFDDLEDGNCNCVGTPCPEAGTACDDGDPLTVNDAEDGNCNCAGEICPEVGTACDDGDPSTFDDVEDGFCNCVGTPCPEAGTACDDGDPLTMNDVEDGNCNCAGEICPEAGTACDDGDPSTFDDIADGNCGCTGTPCPEAGTACDDSDPSTFDDVEDGNCNCVGTPCPEAGTACDDGDPLTVNDVEDGNCNCAGEICPEAGTACDDGDPATFDDVEDGFCNCAGTPCPEAGTACDDGDPLTRDDVEDGNCNCAGTPCPEAGTACDDGDPSTFDDVEDGNCGCAGTPCPEAGTTCDDGDPSTFDDVEDGNCNCVGTPCPAAGTACDDGNPATFDDVEDGNCGCAGAPCPEAGTACDDGNMYTENDVEDGACNCEGTPIGLETLTLAVGGADDDAEERLSNGLVSLTSSDLELGFDGDRQLLVGIRFNDLNIEPGSTIMRAYIQFTANDMSSSASELTIYGQAIDHAPIFTSSPRNVSNRAKTVNKIEWSPSAWSMDGVAGANQQTPDLKPVLQEIISRPGWFYGNSVAFLIEGTGTRTAYAYNGSPENAPRLYIEYRLTCFDPGVPCNDKDPTTFDDQEDGNCNCVGTPCPEAGSACDDGNPATFDDTEDGFCNCEGTPCPEAGTTCDDGNPATFNDREDGFCNCVGIPCPEAGTACDDGDPSTFNDQEDGNCNCVGTPCPEAGTACDDGDPSTFSDQEDGNCNCVGTPCPEAGTACDDGDPSTFDDTEDGFCNCIGTPCPEAGTACDDGDPSTFDDTEDGFCNCIGTPCPDAGTACSDGNPMTFNDMEDGNCNCVGTPCPPAGTACDDGNSSTFNDMEDGSCGCAGTPCPEAGTACDDGDPSTFDDVEDGNCNCIGTPCPEAGTACDDGDPLTVNDVEDGNCNCAGEICAEAGTPCDDGDPSTFDDLEDGFCNCVGTPCPEAGTACDDGNIATENDVEDGNCNCAGTPSESLNVLMIPVNSADDDAEERERDGFVDMSSMGLELVYDVEEKQIVGIRFNGVGLEQREIVTSAYIQFTARDTTSGMTSVTIAGQDADNAEGFSANEFDMSSRTKTAASADWTIPGWTVAGASGMEQRTSDLSAIIQEIVNRDGWVSGNSLVLFLEGMGTKIAESYDGSPDSAPVLVIEYLAGSTFTSVDEGLFKGQPAQMELFPNPATERLTVRTRIEALTRGESGYMTVYHVDGRLIWRQEYKPLPGEWAEEQLDVSRLSPGFYFVSVHAGKEVITRRFVKVR